LNTCGYPNASPFPFVEQAHLSPNEWDVPAERFTGFGAKALAAAVEAEFQFLHGKELECRSIVSEGRERTITATLHVLT